MNNPVLIMCCGASLILLGVIKANELMLATGVVLCAMDYSANRIIDAVRSKTIQQGGE